MDRALLVCTRWQSHVALLQSLHVVVDCGLSPGLSTRLDTILVFALTLPVNLPRAFARLRSLSLPPIWLLPGCLLLLVGASGGRSRRNSSDLPPSSPSYRSHALVLGHREIGASSAADIWIFIAIVLQWRIQAAWIIGNAAATSGMVPTLVSLVEKYVT